ncbi:hypothetical protein ACN28S_57580 [Cystobacter fuscus]
MRALQLERLDGPEGLKLVELPEPEAGDQVLIDVVAAGVSFRICCCREANTR